MSSYWQHMAAGAFARGSNKPPQERAARVLLHVSGGTHAS